MRTAIRWHRRVFGLSELFNLNVLKAASAGMVLAWSADIRRAPSPLNGERAGVRGESKCGRFLAQEYPARLFRLATMPPSDYPRA
jgi:hypothetical protein